MVFEWVAEAAKAKRCGFNCQRSVVKDRERHCLLIALIVRRRGVIFCKHRQRGCLQCSPIKAKAREDLRHLSVRAEVRTPQRLKCDCPRNLLVEFQPCPANDPCKINVLAPSLRDVGVNLWNPLSPR